MYTNNPKLMAWLRQNMATSGAVPDTAVLGEIVGQENDAANRKALAAQELAEKTRQFNERLQMYKDTQASNNIASLGSAAGNLGMMYLMKNKWV